MAEILSRNERLYLVDATSLLTIPNTAGAANVAVGDYACHNQFQITVPPSLVFSECKNGKRSARPGVPGREWCTWSAKMQLESSGTATDRPGMGSLLRSFFGAAHTAVTGTGAITGATTATPIVITQVGHGKADGDVVRISGVTGNTAANGVWVINVTGTDTYQLVGSAGNAAYVSGGTATFAGIEYRLTDDVLPFIAYLFRTPNTAQQHIMYGGLVGQMNIQLGADRADADFTGEGVYQLDSTYFASEEVENKAGLTAFPTEPTGTLADGGGIVPGFKGRFVVGSNAYSGIHTATLSLGTGNTLIKEFFGRSHPDTASGAVRNYQLSFDLNDNDTAAQQSLWTAYKNKSLLDFIVQIGVAPLNTWVFQLGGVQLSESQLNDPDPQFVRSYNNARITGGAAGGIMPATEVRLNII